MTQEAKILDETAKGASEGQTTKAANESLCNCANAHNNDFYLRRDALEYALRLKAAFITDEDQVLEAAKKFENYLLGK